MLEKVEKGIAALYGAVVRQASWTDAASKLSEAIGAAGGTLLVYSAKDARRWQMCESTIGPEFRDQYFSDFVDDSPTHALLRRSPVMTIASADDLLSEGEFRDTRMYRQFLKPFGLGRIMSAHIAKSADEMIAAAFYRTSSQPSFENSDKTAFTLFMSHIERAVRIEGMVSASSALNELSLSALDQTNTGIIFVDKAGRLISTNATGDHLLRSKALTVMDGHVKAARTMDTAALHRAIRTASGDWKDAQDAKPTVTVCKPDGSPMLIQVLPAQNWVGEIGSNLPVAALVIRDPSLKRSSPWENLQRLFGLTPTELKIIQALAEIDLPQKEVAAKLGMAFNTLKGHRLRAYDKLGVDSHASLVRLVNEYNR
jgi:DNA-binding CsgD family transcriptional regulator